MEEATWITPEQLIRPELLEQFIQEDKPVEEKVVSNGVITQIRGSSYHVFNVAHVPMSPSARTSVLDLWSRSKDTKKNGSE